MPNIGDIIRADDLDHIIGQIIAVPYNSAPARTLICDGAEISREAYSELFNVIGTMYGEGDSSTTFNIPDLRDKWIKYYGAEDTIGDSIEEGLPNITGSFIAFIYNGSSIPDSGTGAFKQTAVWRNVSWYGTNYIMGRVDYDFNASRSSAIYGNSEHVTPNSIVLLPCIIFE